MKRPKSAPTPQQRQLYDELIRTVIYEHTVVFVSDGSDEGHAEKTFDAYVWPVGEDNHYRERQICFAAGLPIQQHSNASAAFVDVLSRVNRDWRIFLQLHLVRPDRIEYVEEVEIDMNGALGNPDFALELHKLATRVSQESPQADRLFGIRWYAAAAGPGAIERLKTLASRQKKGGLQAFVEQVERESQTSKGGFMPIRDESMEN